MRISDWSSDVCSSDLLAVESALLAGADFEQADRFRRLAQAQHHPRTPPGTGGTVPAERRLVESEMLEMMAGIVVATEPPGGETGDPVGLRHQVARALGGRRGPRQRLLVVAFEHPHPGQHATRPEERRVGTE